MKSLCHNYSMITMTIQLSLIVRFSLVFIYDNTAFCFQFAMKEKLYKIFRGIQKLRRHKGVLVKCLCMPVMQMTSFYLLLLATHCDLFCQIRAGLDFKGYKA